MLAENESWQNLIKVGFEKAFEILFHLYFERLSRFAKGYVIDQEISKELVQDAFLKLWEIRESLGSDANYKAILYTITRNNSLNYLKHEIVKKKYRQNNIIRFSLELNYIALNDTSFEAFIANDLNIHIKKIINELPKNAEQLLF
jgi:RNA polymerase sigma-70 factor (ECF subfamily)